MQNGLARNGLNIFISTESEPAVNLAMEEILLDAVSPEQTFIMLYRNVDSVICGRFQNPWLEADVDWLAENLVPIIRRASGGGTVWHDRGNWNISFMSQRSDFNQSSNLGILASWLQSVSFPVDITPRGDLFLVGRKISGNAMIKKSDRVLHHCSLLVESNLKSLRRSLDKTALGQWTIESKSVRSQPSPVTSLKEYQPELQAERLLGQLITMLESKAATQAQEIALEDMTDIEAQRAIGDLVNRNHSWEWNFGQTPEFSVSGNGLQPNSLVIHQGRVNDGPKLEHLGLGGKAFPGFRALRIMTCQEGDCRVK